MQGSKKMNAHDSRSMAVHSESSLTLKRLQPQLDAVWNRSSLSPIERQEFESRLETYFGELFDTLLELYGDRYDFFFHLQQILTSAAQAWVERSQSLKALDRQRINCPDWFSSQKVVGGALYVDLFSGSLNQLRQRIDYFKELGLTYLHLMPLFAVRPGDNDGGYAISDYRSVDPRLGTIQELRLLADELREAGIVLVLDFVFNHTSDDHLWAKMAQSGNYEHQQYYYIFPDRKIPDQYEHTLREIFPTVRRGNFTWHDGMQQWVWTTFNSFQWDLNYSNPAVFTAMLGELFFIANLGVDMLRLDAVAFIWKQMGTSCENRPKAHLLIQAFNRLTRIATPSLLFKSEAIVHPDDVVKYISKNECQISYNPTLMALLWESLATKKPTLLSQSLSHRHHLPDQTAWVNYLRCHDDIGWTFDDADAAALGINGYDHRRFLNQFYTGQFDGSFARGVPFQQNLATGDMRISGTMASLAGLELALDLKDPTQVDLAIGRITLLFGVSLSVGGIPLLYLGEEWGVLNDYDFTSDPTKASDSRWVHRSKMNWDYFDNLVSEPTPDDSLEASIRRRIFTSIQNLINCRKSLPGLAGQKMELVFSGNPHVLGFLRIWEGNRITVLGNFSDESQTIKGNHLRTAGLGRFFRDMISDQTLATSHDLVLEPYQIVWLVRQ